MTLYSPFDAHPGQQWSNLRSVPRPVRPFNELATRSSDESVATNSPKPVIVLVRMSLNAQHIQFQTLPHFDASPSPAAGHWRERFKRVLRCLSASASFSRHRGPFLGRSKFLGAFKAPRTSSLLNSSQEPSSGLSKRFQMFLRFVVHTEQHTEESEGNVPNSTGEIRNVEC